MKKSLLHLLFTLLTIPIVAQSSQQISVVQNSDGMSLLVDGEEFMINGMNWDYYPIGTNFSYSLWNQADDIIMAALDSEMSMLKNMGVNAIRVYTGIQPRWIQYIYENYGIYIMLNHSFGRYGLPLEGTFVPNTEYADPRVRQLLLAEVTQMVEDYQNTPGLLLYLLGNENNYGLFWEGAETEDIPIEDHKSTTRARAMYKLFNEAVVEMKKVATNRPIAICNGDLLFLEIIAEECKDIDIFGTNVYRGVSFGDAFQRVRDELNKPILFTEFGADAFNARDNQEDQASQAYYMVGNWKEIYENAAGLGKAGNSLGGFTFQFSDGWWKYGQTERLDVHDNNASWANGGYQSDFVEGENNMNEEWFGICAKGPTNARGLYQLYPRAAYYALKEAHQLDPYGNGVTLEDIQGHFSKINAMDAMLKARGDQAALENEELKKVRLSGLRADLTTFNTGGKLISSPDDPDPLRTSYPNQLGFDHMQSFYVDFEARPSESFRTNVSFNILGNVTGNPINEIFYENRGRVQTVQLFNSGTSGSSSVPLTSVERLRLYNFNEGGGGATEPLMAAPTPTEEAANVLSLFSDTYIDVVVDYWRTDWSAATFEDVQVDGNPTKKYAELDFVGIETVSNTIDASEMTHFHIDVWSADFTFFGIKLVDFGADGTFGGGDDVEHQINFEGPAQGGWVSYDIPLSDFTGLSTKGHVAQYILVGQASGATTIFVDNIYFHK